MRGSSSYLRGVIDIKRDDVDQMANCGIENALDFLAISCWFSDVEDGQRVWGNYEKDRSFSNRTLRANSSTETEAHVSRIKST
jgi:hypothetical protein